MIELTIRAPLLGTSCSLASILVVVAICACVALPSIPTRASSIKEVEHWLEAFATLKGIPLDDLQEFERSGRSLLALTKSQCCKFSPDWGDMIYTALNSGIVDSSQLNDLA